MHSGLWETVVDTLFWLQLCWIFSGFVLMAYLAFKVFPGNQEPDVNPTRSLRIPSDAAQEHSRSEQANPELIAAGKYRLEAFPQPPIARVKVLEFESIVSKPNRRWS